LGFRDDCFEVGQWKKGLLHQCLDPNKLKWCFFLVYGPADHRRSDEFLGELTQAVAAAPYPVVVGGDFNLIRAASDKSNANISWSRIRRFNEAIATMALREVERAGARYTWTNKRLRPTRCVLDRVLVSPIWEAAFPLCSLTTITRVGSDHSPLLLSSGEDAPTASPGSFSRLGGSGCRGLGTYFGRKSVVSSLTTGRTVAR
jgi:hypothetical protein